VKQPPSTHDKSSRTTNGSSITSSPKVFLQENIYKRNWFERTQSLCR